MFPGMARPRQTGAGSGGIEDGRRTGDGICGTAAARETGFAGTLLGWAIKINRNASKQFRSATQNRANKKNGRNEYFHMMKEQVSLAAHPLDFLKRMHVRS